MIFDNFDSTIHQKSARRRIFPTIITDVYHYETYDNDSHSWNSSSVSPATNDPSKSEVLPDNETTFIELTGYSGLNIKHSKSVKGSRSDYQQNSLLNIFVPPKHSGHVPFTAVGDYALVHLVDQVNKPLYVGALHSKSSNWTNAIEKFERPVPPSLEMRGSYGEVVTYNSIYLTYHPKYKPSGQYFGKEKEDQIWYDRFVLFESGDIYRNKKNLIDYNEWIKDTFENKEEGSETILRLVEDPTNLKYMDRFFYLKSKNYPFRPDPVFDFHSSYHQSITDDSVIKTKSGVNFNFAALSSGSSLDVYPVTHTHLSLSNSKLLKTAYDETINQTLAEVREKAKLKYTSIYNTEEIKFVPDIANKNVPFEFKESREIRLGRNKIVMADVYGDQSQLFMTFKTAKDQGLTTFYHRDGYELSQIRLRGNLGESLLIESKSTDFSRLNLKGVSGHIHELFDNKADKNFIYSLTSDSSQLSQSWGLSKASYLMIANKQVDGGSRVGNNVAVSHYNGRAGASGRYNINGVYDGAHHTYSALLLDSGKQSYTENWTHFNGGTWVHDVRRGLSGDAQGFHRAQQGGSYIQYTYSAAQKRWQLHNDLNANIEMDKKDIKLKTAPGGNNYLYAQGGKVDIRGDVSAKIQSPAIVSAIAPLVNLGGEGGPPAAKNGDLVDMSGVVAMTAWGPAPLVGYGVIIAICSPMITCGSAPAANTDPEFNLEGGGI